MHWLVLVISEWTKDTLTWGAMGRITFGGRGGGCSFGGQGIIWEGGRGHLLYFLVHSDPLVNNVKTDNTLDEPVLWGGQGWGVLTEFYVTSFPSCC